MTMTMTTTDGGDRFYLIARTEYNRWSTLERHEVYAIDDEKCILASTKTTTAISPIDGMCNYLRRGCSRMICCEGSRIFVIGGLSYPRLEYPHDTATSLEHMSQEVWHIDVEINDKDGVLSTDKHWTQGPCMLSPRFEGSAASYDGKVYVFGGLFGWPGEANEFFTIRNGLWSPFPVQIPDVVDEVVTARHLVDEKGQADPSILIISRWRKTLRQYHLSTGIVEVIDTNFRYNSIFWMKNFEVSGENNNILVTHFDAYNLYGYNLRTKTASKIGGLSDGTVLPRFDYDDELSQDIATSKLFSIGRNGKLCFIWGHKFVGPSGGITRHLFFYAKFTVKEMTDGSLLAETENVRSFYIEGAKELISCLTIDDNTHGSRQIAAFGKPPSVAETFDKAYLGIDPLTPPSCPTEESSEPLSQNPKLLAKHQVSEDLHRYYDEAIARGVDGLEANTQTMIKVFERPTRLNGVDFLISKGANQAVVDAHNDQLAEMDALREEAALEKRKREIIEERLSVEIKKRELLEERLSVEIKKRELLEDCLSVEKKKREEMEECPSVEKRKREEMEENARVEKKKMELVLSHLGLTM